MKPLTRLTAIALAFAFSATSATTYAFGIRGVARTSIHGGGGGFHGGGGGGFQGGGSGGFHGGGGGGFQGGGGGSHGGGNVGGAPGGSPS